MARAELPDDDYDPFEEFNRASGSDTVENPYPLFALVRGEHPMKREDMGDTAMVQTDSDLEIIDVSARAGVSSPPPRPLVRNGPTAARSIGSASTSRPRVWSRSPNSIIVVRVSCPVGPLRARRLPSAS